MVKQPRHLVGYHVQPAPDSCQNCKKRRHGTVTEVGNVPVLTCSLACLNPEKPAFCDEVDPMGICDAYVRGDPAPVRTQIKALPMDPKVAGFETTVGFVCPHCGHKEYHREGIDLYCNKCCRKIEAIKA